jgi:hypothetical protein
MINEISAVKSKSFSLGALKEKWFRQLLLNPRITHSVLKIAIAISLHMNREERGKAFPGHDRIMEETGLSKNTVRKGIALLESEGHLKVCRSFKKGRASEYYPVVTRTTEKLGAPSYEHRNEDLGAPSYEPQNEKLGAQPGTFRGSGASPQPVIEPVMNL